MTTLETRILELVKAKPGQKAIDIALALKVEKGLVNSTLHGQLKGKVKQDRNYRWYPQETTAVRHGDGYRERLNTPLARLCQYYLDCLSHDDLGGVSVFAESKYGDPDYVELPTLPMIDEPGTNLFGTEPAQRLLSKIRRDRNQQTILLGYPIRMNWIKSRKSNWEGFLVEPLFLFAFHEADRRYGTPVIADDQPLINFKALRSLSNAGDSNLMEEAILLSSELGFGGSEGDSPELDDWSARLSEIRSEWDWRERPDPYNLNTLPSISELKAPGIYNKAILVAAERSPYTKGLEQELGRLQTVSEDEYHRTAVGTWLGGQTIESQLADQKPLLEVLPLNNEQRQAVRQALTNPLTVITGPPGTGKSQVVTSILVNAAWQGRTVLFASKNNKAVDVVEERVNSLGPRPVLLRMGKNQYQNKLAEYLVSLLAAKATPDDTLHYYEYESIHTQLQKRSEMLDVQLQSLVELRNKVDYLEQRVESFRQEVGDEFFRRMRETRLDKLKQAVECLQSTIKMADRSQQPFMTRFAWPILRNKRFARLEEEGKDFSSTARQMEIPLPECKPDSATIANWLYYGECLASRLGQVASCHLYFSKLGELTAARPVEELSNLRRALVSDLQSNSDSLWLSWLRLQPARLSRDQRNLLGDYHALLQMIVSADEQNQRLGKEVFSRYYRLFPKIIPILPCWAVTSLSAKGRIPLEAAFFDLLVVDEASQCDIASVLPLLYRARNVVVIGDPMQLRHISTLARSQDQQLQDKHGLLSEYPGWAYSIRSLFDLASSLCRSEDIVALRDHHRSHADIIEFSNKEFYEDRLRVATNYSRLRRPYYDKPAIRWVDVPGKAVRPGNGGAINEQEARAVVTEIRRLFHQGYRGSIGVVSPFRAQANKIKDLVYADESLGGNIPRFDFLSDTVHGFQGDERDVMIFSPVVSEGISRGALGFLGANKNLFNVAITRARAALIVVGDKSAALTCGVDYLAKFAVYADQVGTREPVHPMPGATDLGQKYPPVSNPERVSDWERLFYEALYRANLRPLPQYLVEKYVLDFALTKGDRRLAIEVDGERYHRNWDGELCRRDQIRNERLMELGWDVMRFWVYQIRDDLENCIARVQKWASVA